MKFASLRPMRVYVLLVLVLALVFAFGGCRKQRITTDPSARLEFSRDTVFFDTVFTTIGSTTQLVRVYNRNSETIVIDEIALEGGSPSNYRINVDGYVGPAVENIQLRGGDSLWLFVEVTVDPSDQNLPFVVEDRVRFSSNGNDQGVELVAWGQDAIFHGGPRQISVLPCDEVWTPEKPHVIYGVVAVDENCNLTINAGTQVYCHARSGLYVFRGSLDVQGQKGNEVVFQGDRLESQFAETPGQWGIELAFEVEGSFGIEEATVARGGIWLFESTGSTIDYAILKNGTIGIQVDTTGTTSNDALLLTNTVITNMEGIGLFAQGASVSGWNNLVTNCGRSCAAFTIGGSYRFAYSTFANYWTSGNRQSPAFIMNNYYLDFTNTLQVRSLTNTWFHNCLVYGNNANLTNFNEFVVDLENEEAQDYRFEFCAVDTDEDLSNSLRYNAMLNGSAPPFVNPSALDFHLSANASSIWAGGFPFGDTWNPPTDLDAFPRSFPGRKGCYEGQ